YSLESAALFNPSIVPHPDQSGVPAGGLRFIISLRATGEGHISSITFRTGMIHPGGRFEISDVAPYLTEPRQISNPLYEKDLSERIIFPTSPSQRNGIEDARFVSFRNDDGTRVYYATFTAYDGRVVMPELLETFDFLKFRFITLNGPAAQNKGMALFPRKINGLYAMLSRLDNEKLYLVLSDNVHFWYEPRLILAPAFPWEAVQIGNCG